MTFMKSFSGLCCDDDCYNDPFKHIKNHGSKNFNAESSDENPDCHKSISNFATGSLLKGSCDELSNSSSPSPLPLPAPGLSSEPSPLSPEPIEVPGGLAKPGCSPLASSVRRVTSSLLGRVPECWWCSRCAVGSCEAPLAVVQLGWEALFFKGLRSAVRAWVAGITCKEEKQ